MSPAKPKIPGQALRTPNATHSDSGPNIETGPGVDAHGPKLVEAVARGAREAGGPRMVLNTAGLRKSVAEHYKKELGLMKTVARSPSRLRGSGMRRTFQLMQPWLDCCLIHAPEMLGTHISDVHQTWDSSNVADS